MFQFDTDSLRQIADDALRYGASLGASAMVVEISENDGLNVNVRKQQIETIEQTRDKLTTTEERAAQQEKEAEKKLNEATALAQTAQTQLKTFVTERGLLDVASPVASTPAAAKLIVQILSPLSETDENNNVVVNMAVTDDSGKTEVTKMTPAEAVKHLESDAAQYGPLFQSTVAAGGGGGQPPRSVSDIDNMPMEQYMAERRKAKEQGRNFIDSLS